jgi:hypothetical protein
VRRGGGPSSEQTGFELRSLPLQSRCSNARAILPAQVQAFLKLKGVEAEWWWLMTVIPATWDTEIRRIKPLVNETPILTNKPDMVVHICNPKYVRGICRGF